MRLPWLEIETDFICCTNDPWLHECWGWAFIGLDDALILQEGKLSLNPRCFWVDAYALDTLLNDSETLLKAGPPDWNAIGAKVDQALALHAGTFLSGEGSAPLLESFRTSLQRRLNTLILHFGHRLETAGQVEAATRLYEIAQARLDPPSPGQSHRLISVVALTAGLGSSHLRRLL